MNTSDMEDTVIETTTPVKACKGCGEVKPLEDFRRHHLARDGRHGLCEPCLRQAQQDGAAKARSAPAREPVTESPAPAPMLAEVDEIDYHRDAHDIGNYPVMVRHFVIQHRSMARQAREHANILKVAADRALAEWQAADAKAKTAEDKFAVCSLTAAFYRQSLTDPSWANIVDDSTPDTA